MLFLFRKHVKDDRNTKLADKIRNDLTTVFKNKGINVSQINIDVRANRLSVQVYVGQQLGQAING